MARTDLNLSGIFRAIGLKGPRQSFDVVEVVQPTVQVGDFSKLGPSVLPPTSIFGGHQSSFTGDRAYNTLIAPPEGCYATWSAFVATQPATSRQANEIFQFRIVETPVTYDASVQWPGFRSGHQASRATMWGATFSGLPPGATYWPSQASANGVIYRHYVPGGWHLEVWCRNADLTLFSEWTVEDTVVQPLPDSSVAATP